MKKENFCYCRRSEDVSKVLIEKSIPVVYVFYPLPEPTTSGAYAKTTTVVEVNSILCHPNFRWKTISYALVGEGITTEVVEEDMVDMILE